jgi:hypothetical protein
MSPALWSWRKVQRTWVLCVAIACAVALSTRDLLRSWSESELSRALEGGAEFTLAHWNYGQHLRYDVVEPTVIVLMLVVLPGALFRATRLWLRANATRTRPIPRLLHHWLGVWLVWGALLYALRIVLGLLRFGNLPLLSLAPIGLTGVFMALRAHLHPRVLSFDARHRPP